MSAANQVLVVDCNIMPTVYQPVAPVERDLIQWSEAVIVVHSVIMLP